MDLSLGRADVDSFGSSHGGGSMIDASKCTGDAGDTRGDVRDAERIGCL
jgi:hypothetical protein